MCSPVQEVLAAPCPSVAERGEKEMHKLAYLCYTVCILEGELTQPDQGKSTLCRQDDGKARCMWQSKTQFVLQSEQAAAHFGALLKMVRHRQGVRQLEVLAHLPGWTQATYSRVETGEVAPAFAQLAQIYTALQLAGVELSAADRQQFLTLARLRIEAKKTYQEHKTDQEWDELRLRLSRTEQDASTDGQPTSRQRSVITSPRLVETRHLVGREDWLASVAASLQETLPKKLIVLQGPVGIGKSSELHRLALHLLSVEAPRFQVSLCELPTAGQETDPESALDLLLGTLLAELGSPDTSLHLPSLDLRTTYALHTLEKASRPVLLFVDNGERLLDAEGRFAPCWERFMQRFLRSQHRSTLILATREWPGWFEGERTFVVERVVPPLSSEAGALLLQRLGLADIPVESLQQASETVGGVPLCLEWVASLVQEPMWLDEWQESDDLDETDEGDFEQVSTRRLVRLLDDASLFGGPIATKLHPLLERIIEKRLSSEAYQVLCTLSLAHIPLGKPALPLLCPHPRLLKELSATSLLVAYPQRVQVLPMVASAVQARLSTEQHYQIEERLIEVYRLWLDDGKASIREMGMIITELAVLYLRHHRLLDAAQLLTCYGWISFKQGYAFRLAYLAADVKQRFDWHISEENECGGLLLHYLLAPFLGKSIDARQRFTDHQRINEYIIAGKVKLLPTVQIAVTHDLMLYAMNRVCFEEAQELLEACSQRLTPFISSQVDLQASLLEKQAWLFGMMSEYAEEQEGTQEAKRYREKAIAIYRQCNALLSANEMVPTLENATFKRRLARTLNHLGYHLNRIGQHEEALQVIEDSIVLKEREYVQVGSLAASYGEKAEALAGLGRYQEALQFDEKALADVQKSANTGHRPSQEEVWIYRVNRGRLYLRLGKIDEAEQLLQEALPHIHPRRRMYRMFAEDALEEIEQWRRTTAPRYQLDWRWVERYRELASYDGHWWLASAGPLTEEEQHQWNHLCTQGTDEATKEQMGLILAQARRRELVAALAEHREPCLTYPAIPIEEVRRRIADLLALDAQIDQEEPNALVRKLYHRAITEEEIYFLRIIEATYEEDTQRFWEFNRLLNPLPTSEQVHEALSHVIQAVALGLQHPNSTTREVSQQLVQFIREHLHLPVEMPSAPEEAQDVQPQAPVAAALPAQKLPARAAQHFFEAVLQQSGYDGWGVVIDPNATAPRVEQGLRRMFLPASPMTVERIRHYLSHEIAGHAARCLAGEHSALGLLGIHTRNSLITEEGLALYQEREVAQLHGQTYDESGIWQGTLATGLASGVVTPPQTFLSLCTFFELFFLLRRLLRQEVTDMEAARERARHAALARCLRTYRGVPDLTRAGVCYLKDAIYLHGLRMIERAVAQDETILDRLAVGVIALDDLPDLQALGIAAPAQPLRKLVYDPKLDSYILSFIVSEKEDKDA